MSLVVQLDGELLERAKKQCKKEERTPTSLIRYALRKRLFRFSNVFVCQAFT